jgi:hypothetical protein
MDVNESVLHARSFAMFSLLLLLLLLLPLLLVHSRLSAGVINL